MIFACNLLQTVMCVSLFYKGNSIIDTVVYFALRYIASFFWQDKYLYKCWGYLRKSSNYILFDNIHLVNAGITFPPLFQLLSKESLCYQNI